MALLLLAPLLLRLVVIRKKIVMAITGPVQPHTAGCQTGILVVDDPDAYRGLVCAALRRHLDGCAVYEADSISSARAMLRQHAIGVVASDMTLPDGTALDLVEHLKKQDQVLPQVIVFSNYSSEDLQPLLGCGDIHAYVDKERGLRVLAETVQKACCAC